MSMPSFPENGANMTREQALTMIIASVAMEESALSRVIDAEGDKLRYILNRCRESCGGHEMTEEILEVNTSVTGLLDVVAQNQAILRNKLALALNACGECPPDPPCPPEPCPPTPCPEQKSLMQLGLSGDGFLWKTGCSIPWEYLGGRGNAVRWNIETPSMVELDPDRVWSVNCMFLVRDFSLTAASGCIDLEMTGAAGKALPLCFSLRCSCGEAVTIPYSTLLLPDSASTVSFRLRSKCPVWVEQAELNIVEL